MSGILKGFVAILAFIFVAGCYYYKVKTTIHPLPDAISSVPIPGKTFVIHTDDAVFVLDSVLIATDSVKGTSAGRYQLPSKSKDYPVVANSSNRYWWPVGEKPVFREVHFYLGNIKANPGKDIPFSFSFGDINRLDIYEQDVGRTVFCWVLGTAGVTYGAFILFVYGLLFAYSIWGSCPYVYVNTGNGLSFAGEIYSGAIYAPLERDDYLVLPGLVEENGQYMLKMSNEQQQEIQHTNLIELVVCDHPQNTQILVDKYGKYQTAFHPECPIRATNFCGDDILDFVAGKDSISYCGPPPGSDIPLTDGVIMSFNIPEGIESGKLFIRARNSLWLDHTFKQLFGLFGDFQDTWLKIKNKSDPRELLDWSLDQKIPLSVYVERNGEWVFYDFFHLAGPMALKDDVLSVDLRGITGSTVKIKLESGSHFWEIDYAGMEFSANVPVNIMAVKPACAVTEDGRDVSDLLYRTDSLYYIQSDINNMTFLSFQVPAGMDSERTVILHSSGYYQMIIESRGLPHLARLSRFRNPDYFPEYSRELMKSATSELKEQGMLVMVPD